MERGRGFKKVEVVFGEMVNRIFVEMNLENWFVGGWGLSVRLRRLDYF